MWTSRLAKNLEECRQAKHGRFKTPGCKGLKMVVTLCVLCYNKVSRAVSRKIMVHSTRVHSLPPKKPTAGYTVLCILWYDIILIWNLFFWKSSGEDRKKWKKVGDQNGFFFNMGGGHPTNKVKPLRLLS